MRIEGGLYPVFPDPRQTQHPLCSPSSSHFIPKPPEDPGKPLQTPPTGIPTYLSLTSHTEISFVDVWTTERDQEQLRQV